MSNRGTFFSNIPVGIVESRGPASGATDHHFESCALWCGTIPRKEGLIVQVGCAIKFIGTLKDISVIMAAQSSLAEVPPRKRRNFCHRITGGPLKHDRNAGKDRSLAIWPAIESRFSWSGRG